MWKHEPKAIPSRAMRDAYTLVELLIVVALLGLAGALLVPRLVEPDTLSTQAAVRLIIADLTFAQSDALANQEFRRVQFYDDGSGYCIVRVPESGVDAAFDPDTADYINDPLAPVGQFGAYIVKLNEDGRFQGVTIESASFDGGQDWVSYDPLGGTIATGGTPGTGGEIV
ncbi:MAG: prepilin-type N-terminal cleavage/methylation domain-containing protein, partial [Phycisphaerales bacterium]|nr:prepilin-type N-terminal cleavage/methylation domain-containing protein [Phycisphaerales bacterium]